MFWEALSPIDCLESTAVPEGAKSGKAQKAHAKSERANTIQTW